MNTGVDKDHEKRKQGEDETDGYHGLYRLKPRYKNKKEQYVNLTILKGCTFKGVISEFAKSPPLI